MATEFTSSTLTYSEEWFTYPTSTLNVMLVIAIHHKGGITQVYMV